ncbi:MAG TPA: hypothetical protein VEY69_10805, partial [Lautropia sp.]|nr:hypothetical protein [Lautropia sp.]
MEQAQSQGATADYKESDGATEAAEKAKARRQTEGAPAPVIPDCCNIGVCLRTIIVLNGAAIATALALAPNLAKVWPQLLAIALILEPALLLCLGSLCIVRKWTNGQQLKVQWVVALALPALVTAMVAWVVVSAGLLGSESRQSPALWTFTRAVSAAVIAAALFEYFRLRARAY